MIKKSDYRLNAFLTFGLLLNSCGQGTRPESLQGPSFLRGEHQLLQIRCSGVESSFVTDAMLTKTVDVRIKYQGNRATRTTNFMGCIQVVQIDPIITLDNGVLRMTESEAVCDESTRTQCAPIAAVCNTKKITQDFKYTLTESNQVQVLVPANPEQQAPCGATQDSSEVIFIYRQM